MKAEILCVGTELLLGEIINTNAAFLSFELARMGIYVYYHSVCGDNPERLKRCLRAGLARSDLIVLTGGLGPTYDDLTKETVAETLGLPLVLHQPSLDRISSYFHRSGNPMTENSKKQAYLPAGATVFPNDYGTAPALAVEKDGRTVVMLPGPPREMQPIFLNQVKAHLAKHSKNALFSSNIHIFGMGESAVEEKLRDLMEHAENPTVAPYVKDGEVRIRVTAKAEEQSRADQLIDPVTKKIRHMLGDAVYGVDLPGLEYALVKTLLEKGLSIAVAESCTGGLISKRITDVSGSSAVFGYGICSYSNQAKQTLLGVRRETIERYGAVSEQTAKEMAAGVLTVSGADLSLSVTGIAGPGGAGDKTPVGLVYIACARKGGELEVKKLTLGRGNPNERDYIRLLASSHALKMAFDIAKKANDSGDI